MAGSQPNETALRDYIALLQWDDRWLSDERRPPVLLTHSPCGKDLQMIVACSHCGDELALGNSAFEIQATECRTSLGN